jgi:hypothetical protein
LLAVFLCRSDGELIQLLKVLCAIGKKAPVSQAQADRLAAFKQRQGDREREAQEVRERSTRPANAMLRAGCSHGVVP